MDLSSIIDSITCPITGDIMNDPVQGNDGHTYERTAITEWLSRNPISPQTRAPMNITDLKVNASIRFLCDKYHEGAFGDIAGSHAVAKVSSDSIKINHTISRNAANKTMLSFEIDPESMPEHVDGQESHLSQDVVLVIDHSRSMGEEVVAYDKDGEIMEDGFTIQQLVNNAAKTLSQSAGEFNCPIVFRGPSGAAGQLAQQHSQNFENYYRSIMN